MSADNSDDDITPISTDHRRHRLLSIGTNPRYLPVLRALQSEAEEGRPDRLTADELGDRVDIDAERAIDELTHADLVRSYSTSRGQFVALTGAGDIVLDAIDGMIDTEVAAIEAFADDDGGDDAPSMTDTCHHEIQNFETGETSDTGDSDGGAFVEGRGVSAFDEVDEDS